MEAETGEDRELGLTRLHWGRQELVVAGVKLYHSAVHLISEVLAVSLAVTPSLQVNTESVIAGELVTGAGGQREHLAVGSYSQGVIRSVR